MSYKPKLNPYSRVHRNNQPARRPKLLARSLYLSADQWGWLRKQGGNKFLAEMVARMMTGGVMEGEVILPLQTVGLIKTTVGEIRAACQRMLIPSSPAARASAIEDILVLTRSIATLMEDAATESSIEQTTTTPRLRPWG